MAKISAHRGGPDAGQPQNSLEAIDAACRLGVDLVEFDVRVTRDGRFVVQHDARVRIEGRRRSLRRLDAGQLDRGGSVTVGLEAVLDVLAGRAMAHVDLKDARCEVELADACASVLGPDGFIMTTGRALSVRRLRQARPRLRVGLSLGNYGFSVDGRPVLLPLPEEVVPWRRVRRSGANLLAINHQLARLGVLEGAYRRGLPVLLWTLNTEAQLRSAQHDPRVWAYTTDRPRLALQLAAEPNPSEPTESEPTER
jgi:glycerophosphoryl diester phosphodiesterase